MSASGTLEGFENGQQHDADQAQGGGFVEQPQEAVPVRHAVEPEKPHQSQAVEVVGHQTGDKGQLCVQPPGLQGPPVKADLDQSGADGENGADGHDDPEAPLHDFEALPRQPVCGCPVVDEKPGKIEQAGKPGHHEDDVKGLQYQHGQSSLFAAESRRPAVFPFPGVAGFVR